MAASQPIISTDYLKDVLECPVCLKVPTQPPIFQCERGHLVCGECHPKLPTCPVCRVSMGRTRSLVSEKMLLKLPTGCEFQEFGCQVELLRNKMRDHEISCPFRLIQCVDLACQQKVSYNKLLDHIDNDHEREDFVSVEDSSYKSHFIVRKDDFTREIMWISDHLTFDGKHFFRECFRNSEGLWYVWMYIYGSAKQAEEYVCEVQIINGDEELAFRGRVVSIDVRKEEVCKRGFGLVFLDATARLFWSSEKINYFVAVRKKKKDEKKPRRAKSAVATSTTSSKEEETPPASENAKTEKDVPAEDVKETSC